MLFFPFGDYNKLKKSHAGVTLIELLVVVAIIGVIATIGFVALTGSTDSANDAKRISDVNTIKRALDISRVNNAGAFEPIGTAADPNNLCLEISSALFTGAEIAKLLPVVPTDPAANASTPKKYYLQLDAPTPTTFRVIATVDGTVPSGNLGVLAGKDTGVNTANATGSECSCTGKNYCVGT